MLETARQMLGRPIEDWLIPKLNGHMRLQKPPLPYWLSALSYRIGGVSEFTGRLSFALLAWLTLGVTFVSAVWFFDNRRVGLIAALCLMGSYLFARHTRLAETDGPATLFVTLATVAFSRNNAHRQARLDLVPLRRDRRRPDDLLQRSARHLSRLVLHRSMRRRATVECAVAVRARAARR